MDLEFSLGLAKSEMLRMQLDSRVWILVEDGVADTDFGVDRCVVFIVMELDKMT